MLMNLISSVKMAVGQKWSTDPTQLENIEYLDNTFLQKWKIPSSNPYRIIRNHKI